MARKTHPVDAAKALLARQGRTTDLIETQSVRAGMELLTSRGTLLRLEQVEHGRRIIVAGRTEAGALVEEELLPSPAQYAIRVV